MVLEQRALDENVALKDLILEQLTAQELDVLLGNPSGDLTVKTITKRFEQNRRDAFDLDPNIKNLVERLTLLKEEKEVCSMMPY
eukprot:7684332-Pyramimonas_sp.AAC.1